MLTKQQKFIRVLFFSFLFIPLAVQAADLDRDTLPDDWELANGRDPLVPDYLVAAGWDTTCVKDDNGISCIGNTNAGQNNIPALTDVLQLEVGAGFVCALEAAGSVVCWGNPAYTTVPAMTGVTQLDAFMHHTCAIHDAGISCWGDDTYGEASPPAVANPQDITVGTDHSCAINGNANEVVCWGRNNFGQTIEPALINPEDVEAGSNHICAIHNGGDITCWGANGSGQSEWAETSVIHDATSLALGVSMSCALRAAGYISCWGTDALNESSPPSSVAPVTISAGFQHGCILDEMEVQCWGKNDKGQSDVSGFLFDSDGDGYINSDDDLRLDATEWIDTDLDGIGNNADQDDDMDGVPDSLDIAPLDGSEPLLPWMYEVTLTESITSFSKLGDINLDGYDDVLVGLPYFDNVDSNIGKVVVLSGLDGAVVFEMEGQLPDGRLGKVVEGVGDFNSDGYPDFLAGIPFSDEVASNSGSAKIFSGFDASELSVIYGDAAGSEMGDNITAAGDVDGDGYVDVIARLTAYSGSSLKLYNGVTGTLLQDLSNTVANALSAAGDVNNDGYADIVVGAGGDDTNGVNSGMAWIYSGIDGSIIHNFAGGVLNQLGNAVSALDDINNDGYADVLVAASGDWPGKVRLISGIDGTELYRIQGTSQFGYLGSTLEVVDDLDGDGYKDFVTSQGAYNSVSVFSGKTGEIIYRFVGPTSAKGAGDINADGYGDFATLLGNKIRFFSGASYLHQVTDTDGDGLVNTLDPDMDNDGYSNSDEYGNATDMLDAGSTPPDFDGDFISDINDPDDDNDGVDDVSDAFPFDPSEWADFDNDGIGDIADLDDDADGVEDLVDNCPFFINPSQEDFDGDGLGQPCDDDDDNDGVLDVSDACDYDPMGSVIDTDKDGMCDDGADSDDDNDGVRDSVDPAPLDLADPGYSPLYILTGTFSNENFGSAIDSAGDVNNDGYTDIVIGSPGDDDYGTDSGSVRVVSGVDASTLFTVFGTNAYDRFGHSVAGIGDVNLDNHDDIAVGVFSEDAVGVNSGSVHVYSGIDGTLLYSVTGGESDFLGSSVSSTGDVSGDGVPDFMAGSTGGGYAKVYSGVDGNVLYTFNGDTAGDDFGFSVAGAGDVNADGYPDMVVGANLDSGNGNWSGLARIFSGYDGSVLYSFYGDVGERLGYSVDGAGDVNGDGYGDVITSQLADSPYGLGSGAGSIRVFSGLDGSVIYQRAAGSYGDKFGFTVRGAGDIDQDGYADFMAGIYEFNLRGKAGIYSGKHGDVLYGFVGEPLGDSYFGRVVSPAGDVNGDGVIDVMVGHPEDNNRMGSVWVYDGSLYLAWMDTDGDGLLDTADTDDDNDGMPDEYELSVGHDPLVDDAANDPDGDLQSNFDEYNAGTNPFYAGVPVVDTDGDSDSDVIWRNRTTGSLTLWEIENKAKVSELVIGGLGNNYDLKDTFDTDGDGDTDLILFDESLGQAIHWEMQNNAKVGGSLLATFTGYTIRGLGDLDADGDGDIVWQEVATGRVIVWIMEGGAKQSGNFLGGLGAGSVVEAIGDFDNDGDADLLWSIPSITSLVRWDMEDGGKQSGAAIGGFVGYSIAAVGDFNKDNTDDILWQPEGGGSSIIWLMQNGDKQTGLALGQLANYTIVTVGDYDGDGDDDVLWSNDSGNLKLWELENGIFFQGSDLGVMGTDSDIRP